MMKPIRDRAQASQRQVQRRSDPRTFNSYHTTRQPLDQNRRAPSTKRLPLANLIGQKKLTIRMLPTILISLACAFCLFYITTLSTTSKIVVTKTPSSIQLRDNSIYQQTIDKIINSSVLSRNKISINTSKIQQQILNEFPELDDVTIVLPIMGHRPVVELVVTKPAIRLVSQSGVFLINQQGKVIMAVKDLPQGNVINLPIVTEEADLDLSIGKAALSKQDVAFITTVVEQLAVKKIVVKTLTLPPLASELHLGIEGKPYFAKFSLLADPRLSAGQLIAVSNKLTRDSIVPKQYIDLRVEEKAYYQ